MGWKEKLRAKQATPPMEAMAELVAHPLLTDEQRATLLQNIQDIRDDLRWIKDKLIAGNVLGK